MNTDTFSREQARTVAAKVAREALGQARAAAEAAESDRTAFPLGLAIYADEDGAWQVYSTSKLLRIALSAPLNTQTTATAETLEAALLESYDRRR